MKKYFFFYFFALLANNLLVLAQGDSRFLPRSSIFNIKKLPTIKTGEMSDVTTPYVTMSQLKRAASRLLPIPETVFCSDQKAVETCKYIDKTSFTISKSEYELPKLYGTVYTQDCACDLACTEKYAVLHFEYEPKLDTNKFLDSVYTSLLAQRTMLQVSLESTTLKKKGRK